jgi:hypothetical protein
MSTKARLPQGLGLVLLVGGALLAGAPGANASDATLPTPDAPRLLSATASGCQAPCAPGESGEVVITVDNPTPPPGATIIDTTFANGVAIDPNASKSGDPLELHFAICSGIRQPFEGCVTQAQVDALRGDEVITVRAHAISGNPDDGTQQTSAQSAPSNGLVPTQL